MWRKGAQPVVDDSAYFHFLREAACPAPLILHVQVDGQDVAQLEKGNSAQIRLSPGEHRIHVRPWKLANRNTAPGERSITVGPSEEVDIVIRGERRGWFQPDLIHVEELAWRGKIRDGRPAARMSTVDWSQYRFHVIETGLRPELTGQTSFVEDNRNSDAVARRQTTATNEWTRTVSVGGEASHTRGFTASLGVGWMTIESHLQRTITNQYAIQHGERQQIGQVLEVEIPARSLVQVTVTWRTIWREGFVRIVGPRGSGADVPFRFVHCLEFDRYSISR